MKYFWLLVCLCFQPLFGNAHLNYFAQYRGGFEADALYWRSSQSYNDKFYTATSNTTADSLSANCSVVKPESNWGWRIKTWITPSNPFFADAEYAYFSSSSSNHTLFPGLYSYFAPIPPYIDLNASTKSYYQRTRSRLGFQVIEANHLDFYTYAGVDWLLIKGKDRMIGTFPTNPAFPQAPQSFSQKSEFNAAAIEAGLGLKIDICKGMGVKMELGALGAYGVRKYDLSFQTNFLAIRPTGFTQTQYPNVTICRPGYDLSIEGYTTLWKEPMTLSIGYEYHHFFDVLLLSALFDRLSNFTPNQNDIGFGGLYIAFRTCF